MATAGLKIVLPTTFSDTSLPTLRDDSVLTSGSLMLVDLAHSANPTTGVGPASGVPADAAVLNNIAYKECAAVLGSGTQASLSGVLNVKGAIGNLTKGKVERTGKGGLHVIVSQATALATGDGVSMAAFPAVITAYLKANPTHQYYFSFWDQLTRVNLNASTTAATWEYDFTQAGGGNQFLHYDAQAGFAQAVSGPSVTHAPSVNTLGVRYGSMRQDTSNTISTSGNLAQSGPVWGAPAGSYNQAVLGSRNLNWPSMVFYRMYLEDLTVSGRTYATVDALDYAKYTADVLTSGGRFYGDTYTAPSTIA